MPVRQRVLRKRLLRDHPMLGSARLILAVAALGEKVIGSISLGRDLSDGGKPF
jgi:hypothetical protein